MQFRITLLLSFASLSLGGLFQVPKGLPDGLFHAPFNATTVHHVKMLKYHNPADAVAKNIPNPTTLSKVKTTSTSLQSRYIPLPVSSSGCGTNTEVDSSDWLLAMGELKKACDSGTKIGGDSILAYKVGSVAAYACSFGGENLCGSDEYNWANSYLNNKCKDSLSTGWVYMSDWAKSYGRDILSERLCPTL